MRLKDKIAIITGGANGIGRATALLFAKEGAKVVVADRDVAAGHNCVQTIRAAQGEAMFVETDVSRDASVAALVEATVRQYGGIDILVNCAGVNIVGSVVNTEPERWQRTLDVNLSSIYRTCHFAIPHLIRRGGGSIVNIASIQGMFGYKNHAAYAASKAGIFGLTRQIAVDYADDNIRSNAISPGHILTGLGINTRRLEPDFADGLDTLAASAESLPKVSRLRGPGRPEDVAYAALFLASDEAAHISGHNLVVAGITTAQVA